MGQAKQRGTFEQRKAEAIKAGRVKQKYSKLQIRYEFFKMFANLYFNRGIKNR